MPSERPALRLQHIVENAKSIRAYTDGLTAVSFVADQKTYDAVERCIERICEAVVKLGPAAATLMPDQPWPQFRSLGNRLRHEYDHILADILWEIVQIDVPRLETACVEALRKLEVQSDDV